MAHPQQRIQPEIELRAVKEELDLAKKTIDRYAHLGKKSVAKLYDELDTLRNGICKTCKSKVVPGVSPFSGAGHGSSGPTRISLLRRVQRSASAKTQTKTGSPLSDITPVPRSAEPPTEQASFEPISIPPPARAVVTSSDRAIAEPDKVNYAVEYNPEVRQSLNIHLAHIFKVRSAVFDIKFSRAGKYLAVGLSTGEVYIYDMETLKCRILTIIEGYPAKEQHAINSVQFSPDDKYIATGVDNGQIRVWKLAERRVLAMFKGHTDGVHTVDFSPDGRFLLSTSVDKSVRIWCIRDGTSKQLLDTDSEMSFATSGAISPDSGRYVAAGDYNGVIRIWDSRSGQLLQRWKTEYSLPSRSLEFTLDGKGLLSEGGENTMKYWDINSLMASQSKSRKGELVGGNIYKEMKCLITFHGHKAGVNSLSIFPDSRWVISGADDFTARVWDLRTGAWQCALGGSWAAASSPDGQHLATGNGLVKVWRYKYIG